MKLHTILFILIAAFISTILGYFLGSISETRYFYAKRFERQKEIIDEVNKTGLFLKKIEYSSTSTGYAQIDINENCPEEKKLSYSLVNSYARRLVDGEFSE